MATNQMSLEDRKNELRQLDKELKQVPMGTPNWMEYARTYQQAREEFQAEASKIANHPTS